MPATPQWDDEEDEPVPSDRASDRAPTAVWTAGHERDREVDHDALPAPRREPRAPALEGLTATGAGVVGLIGTTLGAVLDAAVSPGLGWIFFVTFVAMSAFVGLRLRGREAWAALAVPPLVFIAAAGLAAQVAPVTEGGWLQRTSGDMATAVLDHPYVLIIGTLLAGLAVLYRAMID